MKPPAPPADSLATRVMRSAWRTVRAAIEAKHTSALAHAQHGAVWLAVKVAKLDHAKTVALYTSKILPPLSVESARVHAFELATVGTCLSRALTIASRVPGAEVAFGFDPARAPNCRPHAWVVVDGQELVANDGCPTVLTTIRVDR